MNYSALVASVQEYSENDFNYAADPSILNTLIAQAERRIYNTIQFAALRKNSTLTTSNGVAYVNCPSDFLSVYSMAVVLPSGVYEFLLNKDVNFIRASYPNPATTGTPRYYALFGPTVADEAELRFIIGPTPNAALSLDLNYFYYPESIVTAGNTWLGDNFDPVLLYAVLVEAATYMKAEADMVNLYNTKFQEALLMAKRLGDGLERSDAYRNGQARMPVK
jgi:hypothetical protein